MAKIKGVKEFLKSIDEQLRVRILKVFAVAKFYSAQSIQYINRIQPTGIETKGKVWINRTGTAALLMFSKAFLTSEKVGYFIAHGVDYGVWLELANDRRYEIIRPTLRRFLSRFLRDATEAFNS